MNIKDAIKEYGELVVIHNGKVIEPKGNEIGYVFPLTTCAMAFEVKGE